MTSPKATYVMVQNAAGEWSCPVIGGDEAAGRASAAFDEIRKDGTAKFARLVVRGKQIEKHYAKQKTSK